MIFNKESYKLLAVDLDGTMLNNGTLSPRVKKALSKLVAKGVEVAIATGRSLPTVPQCVRDLPFIRYAIVSNGAHVYDYMENETISEEPINMEQALEIIQAIKARSNVIAMYPDVVVLPIRAYIRYLRSFEFWKRLFSKNTSRKIVKEALKSTMLVMSLPRTIERRGQPVEKINLRVAFPKRHAKICKILEEFPVEAVTTMGLDLEINAKGVTKAAGLQALCEHLSITADRVIVAGDSFNDVEMFKHAGYSIAMGNADDEVKAAADIVAPDVTKDGLAIVLKELFKL